MQRIAVQDLLSGADNVSEVAVETMPPGILGLQASSILLCSTLC